MLKMAHMGKYHCNAQFITSLDAVLIADAAARLDNRSNARSASRFYTIVKREKSIRSQYRALDPLPCMLYGLLYRPNPIDLARANAAAYLIFGNGNGIGFCMLYQLPGK